jgi:hypothetical protein
VTAPGAAVADTDAGAASEPRGRARVVTPDGKSTNRNADPANGDGLGKVRNNPAGGKAATQNSQDFVLGAGPRAAGRFQLEPLRQHYPPTWPLAAAGVHDNADSAPAAVPCPACWPDSPDRHASAASVGPLPGKLHCNNDLADGEAGTTVHSLSEDSAGVETAAKGLDRPSTEMDTEVGPREVALPKVKPRRKALTLLRGVLIHASTTPFSLNFWPPLTNSGHRSFWPRNWPTA